MTATFRILGTFDLPSRRLFVIRGNIESGTIKKGMTMKLRLNQLLNIAMPVHAVEIIDHIKEKKSETALCTSYQDADELSFLKSLDISGEVIEVEEE